MARQRAERPAKDFPAHHGWLLANLDASGHPIDFSITGASGTIYDANGAHLPTAGGVPEPGTWAMMLLGFGGLGAILRRRRGMAASAAA